MSERSVVGIYETIEQAEEAVHRLDREGFPVKHVSIVTQNLAGIKNPHGFITPENDLTKRGTVTGAWIGGLCSLLVGAAFLWIPGVGPLLIAGRLAALLFAGTGQAHLAIERVFRYSARVTLPSEAPCIARRTPHGYACALIVS